MVRRNSFIAILTLCIFILGSIAAGDVEAKRVLSDPDAPTNEEAKVLGWGPVKTPNRGTNPEFLVRGVVLDVEAVEGLKDKYKVSILPIEVLNNHQRFITFDNFANGVDVTLRIPKPKLKELKKGQMVEYNQYYTEEVEQSIGGAKMVAFSMHREIQGYPAGPGPYLKKPGFYPVQYKNALKGIKLYSGSIKSDKDIQALVDYLATQSKDPELKTIAINTYQEIYQGTPTGRCNLDKVQNLYVCK